jgi:hypothetical protein
MPLEKQEVLTLPEHLRSPLIFHFWQLHGLPFFDLRILNRRRTDNTLVKRKRTKEQTNYSPTILMPYLTKATTNLYVQVVHVTSDPTVVN